MHTPSSSDVLLWILCAVIVGAAARKVWPFLRQFVHVVDLLSALPGRLDEQDERLETIEHEVTNNDGSSLKDATDRTEALARQTSQLLDEHIEWSKTDTENVQSRLNHLESRLAGDIDQN